MTTHAELSARLLREAAAIFRTMAWPDAEVTNRVETFSKLFDRVADLVEVDPTGEISTIEIDSRPS
ncbi:MAG: hypothetical protein U1E66_01830 [Rhodospirillales bacterium]